jgi:hypothetical protein
MFSVTFYDCSLITDAFTDLKLYVNYFKFLDNLFQKNTK